MLDSTKLHVSACINKNSASRVFFFKFPGCYHIITDVGVLLLVVMPTVLILCCPTLLVQGIIII